VVLPPIGTSVVDVEAFVVELECQGLSQDYGEGVIRALDQISTSVAWAGRAAARMDG
jgi:hypothetical protein